MVEAPTDAVPQILIRIQDSISALRSELGALRSDVGQFKRENETQHEETRSLIRKQQRGSAANDGHHAGDRQRFRRAR
jgi:hypothetical protein